MNYTHNGTQRIVMCRHTVLVSMSVEYMLIILQIHSATSLGSTSLVVDASTGEVVETRERGISLKCPQITPSESMSGFALY